MFVCEICTYPARNATHCDNPACLANPTLSESFKQALRNHESEHAKARAEFEARKARRAAMIRAGFTMAF